MAVPTYRIDNGNEVDLKNKKIFVKDITGIYMEPIYTEDPNNPGQYIYSENTTGYNGENTYRNALAVFLYAVRRTTTEDVPLEVAPNDPMSVSRFEVKLGEDGWYVFYMIVLRALFVSSPEEEIMLSNDEVFYNIYSNKVEKLVGEFREEQLLSSLIGTTYVKSINDKGVLFQSHAWRNELNNKKNRLAFDLKEDSTDYAEVKQEHDLIRGLIEGAEYEFARGNKYIFQKNVEFINRNYC